MRRSDWGLGTCVNEELAWRYLAACPDSLGPDAWIVSHSAPSTSNRAAARVCDRCPVRSDCYEWYLDRPVDLRKNVIAGGEFFNNHGQPQPVTGRISRLGPDGLLSAHAAAALVLCSRRAIVDACHTGELASQRTSGGQWRIRPVDLYEWAGLEGP